VVFVYCVGVSFLCSVFFFLVGWAKYSERENEIRSKTVTAQSPEISFAPAL
jgi:ABC-type transporter Mla subunit MlaD